ncbi:hypothetical protein CEUSTIGMA_g2068.t1 [Chlamydomonas eustigma]|uniref:DUF6826 domain-containing protein n=1 Tax=Chlamydomonas eustigma TaxID=1157962 RepID=A0A250WVR4_9CHLO|nr:hypothetical protein CEUSTIGMA_g2068.t1 [Chlamydomonas eustigma]|eukprot:GAX74620.1 hypothetical protein CEUSTIGMA_g2068.t1 [Chlamydomonas eustigma]
MIYELCTFFIVLACSHPLHADITRSSAGKTRNIKVGKIPTMSYLPTFMYLIVPADDLVKFIVEDTHKKMYLGGCSPDLTLHLAGSPLCAFGTIAVIELQTGSLDNKHRGKAVKYAEELLEALV